MSGSSRSSSCRRRIHRSGPARAAVSLAALALVSLTLLACTARDEAAAAEDARLGPDDAAGGGGIAVDGDTSRADSSDADAGATAPDSCTPSCRGRACGDDGCGGTCGACRTDEECSPQGRCVPRDPDCAETCASLGLACGEHCGEPCGALGGACAGAQEACDAGRCVCRPACTAATCEQDDGCGGTCAPCPRDVSCADCALRLTVTEREEQDGVLRSVTLALDYAPGPNAPLPGMADLRIAVTGDATLTRVGLGEALLEADKSLHVDSMTGLPYRELPGGVIQCLVLSVDNRDVIPAGRWLFFRFRLGTGTAPADGPARFALLDREETFAPPPADQALWGDTLDAPVVVWPEVTP